MATLKDVAARAGVTVTTVSRMLNNRVNVSPKTREKIEAAMKELDYQPDELARSLIKKQSNFIGLIVPSAKNFFFAKVIDCIEHYISEKGYKLLLCISDMDINKEKEYFNMLKANKVAGVIIASHTQNLLDEIKFTAPIITIDRKLSDNIPSVCADNYLGGSLAAEHLISKGCRHPAYISGSISMNMDANKRYIGFINKAKELGINNVATVDAAEVNFINMKYQEIIEKLFSSFPSIDGVFTSNDIIAMQVLEYCKNQGISVPDNLKIIGYDDTDLAVLSVPKLTTIRQPIDDMCKYAVQSIIDSANNCNVQSEKVFSVTLFERETT